MRRCPAQSRSFLLGPDGPAGAPPGQDLRSGSYMAANRSGTNQDQLKSKCPRFQGNPANLERDDLRQLTQMTRGEDTFGYRDLAGDDTLTRQAELPG